MKNNNMMFRISATFLLSLILIQLNGFAQEDSLGPDNRPAKPAFESGYLIDQQTAVIPVKNTLEFAIHHRFGPMNNGASDLLGIYAPSNIRLGLNFCLTDDLLLGIGTTKNKKYQDLVIKYNVLRQTRSLSIPLSITFFENFAIEGQDEKVFGTDYKFSHRFSYFSQLILTHRFNSEFSLQVAPSFTHFNISKNIVEPINDSVSDTIRFDHDKIGISFGGRYKISPQTSIIFGVDMPLWIDGIREYPKPKYLAKTNLSLGVEISTSTHAFQIFVATAQGILPQENMMWNNLTGNKKLSTSHLMLGFNITRLWNF
jgi:hypothetical protein